jgi:hypothetical protein
MNIQTLLILVIVICSLHQNIYDLHVMTYNFLYFFQHTFSFYTYNNKKHKQTHTCPHTYIYKHI